MTRHAPRRRSPRRGFTMLEIALVAGVIVVAAALVVPNLLALQNSNLLGRTADDLRGLLVGLRTRAIEEGIPYEWGFASAGTSYFIRKGDDAASASAAAGDAADARIEFDSDDALGEHALPAGVRLEAVGPTGAGNPNNGNPSNQDQAPTGPTVRFEPDGTANALSFRLVDDRTGAMLGAVRSLTGAATFTRETAASPAGGGS